MEFVFVVPRDVLFPDWYPHGLVPFAEGVGGVGSSRSLTAFEAAVARDGFFVERAYAERTPALKQVIPYSVVWCDGRVLLTRRLRGGGESRLHDKYSIGIGGHINPEDLGEGTSSRARNPIDAGTRREIAEELSVRGRYEIQRVGLLNDDSNAVGAVHVGVVQVIAVEGTVDIRERHQLEGRLVSVGDLRDLLAQGADLETWSKLLLAHIDELLLVAQNAPTSSRSSDTDAELLPKPLVVSH
jgi:predicted NUDIX family phosphoesterase